MGASLAFYKNLAYTDSGKGTVLLFLHGFPLDQSLWKRQVNFFQKKYRVITLDLPGLGQSRVPVIGKFNLDDYSDIMRNFLSYLKIEQVILIGHSMGGYVALEFCRKNKEMVTKLILVDTKVDSDTSEKRQKRMLFIKQLQQDKIDGFIQDQMDSLFIHSVRNIAMVKKIIEKNNKENLIILLRAMVKRKAYWDVLFRISVPVLLLVGENDPMLKDMEKIIKKFLEFSFFKIPNAGHISFLDRPAKFNKIMNIFLKGF